MRAGLTAGGVVTGDLPAWIFSPSLAKAGAGHSRRPLPSFAVAGAPVRCSPRLASPTARSDAYAPSHAPAHRSLPLDLPML